MKKIILILFGFIFLLNYSCTPVMTDYLDEAGVSRDVRDLELYEDSSENFNYNLIFRVGNELYVHGNKFLTLDNSSYKYLGHGYYMNNDIVYFFDKEVTKVKGEHEIKAYVKIKVNNGMKGTSCEGQFHDYTYYLEIDKIKYRNDEKEEGFFSGLISFISNFIYKLWNWKIF